MRPRQLNFLKHPMTSRQALGILLDCWSEDRKLPVILITPYGSATDYARRIRVTLAKEKSKKPRAERVSYGFTLSEPFPWTEGNQKGEAILLNWRLTPIQNLRNMRDELMGVTHAS